MRLDGIHRKKTQLGVVRCFRRAERGISGVRANVFEYHRLAGFGNAPNDALSALERLHPGVKIRIYFERRAQLQFIHLVVKKKNSRALKVEDLRDLCDDRVRNLL